MFLKGWNLLCLEECLVFGRRQIEKILATFVLVCAGVQALFNKMIHAAAVWWCNLVLYAFRIQVAGWCNRGVVGVPTELVSVTILNNHVVQLKGARIVCTPCVSQSNFSWTFWSGAISTNTKAIVSTSDQFNIPKNPLSRHILDCTLNRSFNQTTCKAAKAMTTPD